MEFKYTATFNCFIKTAFGSESGEFISKASLEDLRHLVPNSDLVKTNSDLLYNAFDAAVINRANKNDDAISSATATAIFDKFIHKPTNVEHNRTRIVGHIINAGFTKFKSNACLTTDEVNASTDPCYLSLGAVAYKVVDPEFCNLLLESSDETSPRHNQVSASWELGFNKYHVMLGHKDCAEAKIIDDETEVQAYSKYLKAYGGQGKMEDGTPVYRLLAGDVMPLGIGYTTTPAAEVSGVLTVDGNTPENPEDLEADKNKDNIVDDGGPRNQDGAADDNLIAPDDSENRNQIDNVASELELSAANLENSLNIIDISEKSTEIKNNISHLENNIVNKISIMTIKDITDENLKNTSAASIISFLSDEIDKVSTDYATQLDAEKEKAQATEQAKSNVETEFNDLKTKFEQLQTELQTEREARDAEKAQADFNSRMSELNEKYDLSDEKRAAVVARSIRGLNDTDYSQWLEDFSVISTPKVAVATEIATASTFEATLDALKEKEKQSLLNTTAMKSFGGGVNPFAPEDVCPGYVAKKD